MSVRLAMVLELRVPARPARSGTHRQWLAARQAATDAVKRPLLARIDSLRALDPELEVLLQHSPTEMLIVRSTPEVLAALENAPEVARTYPAQDAELAQDP